MRKSFVRISMLALLCFVLDARSRVFGKAPATCLGLVTVLAGGADAPGASEDFRAGIEAFITTFIASAREARLSRVHLIELLAKPLEGKIRELQEDAGTTTKSASIRSLNEVLVAVQTALANGEKFAEARAHFIEAFPSALAAYLATIEDAANGAHTIVEESRKLEQVRMIQVGSPVASTAVSPDGKLIASGSDDGVIRVFDGKTGALVQTLKGHTNRVRSVGWSPDGKYVVSGGADKSVRIWDVASGREINKLKGHTSCVNSVGWSPDGKFLVSGGFDNLMLIWDVDRGSDVKDLAGHVRGVWSVRPSPDGKYVVSGSGDGTVRIWEVASGKQMKEFEGHTDWVKSVSFSPDGRFVVSGAADGTILLWDVASGKEVVRLEEHAKWVKSVSFSPDGRFVVSGSDDGTVRLWEVASGRELKKLEGHSGRVLSVGFSPDGQAIISGSGDGSIRIQPTPPDLYPDPARMEELARMQTKWLEDLRAHPIVFESDRPNAPQQNPVVFESKWRVWWRALLARFGGGR